MSTDFMAKALALAEVALAYDEVPVGAVLVSAQGEVLGSGFNLRETRQSVLQHAEIIALEQACRRQGSWRLLHTTLYVTLEPCLMCAGAMLQARVSKVVYATHDPKGGAMGSLYAIHQDRRLNHLMEALHAQDYQDRSQVLLQNFFKQKRSKFKTLLT